MAWLLSAGGADRLAPPGWLFWGWLQCLRARLHPSPGTGMGFPCREEVQAGQSTAITLQPWLSAPSGADRGKRNPYLGFPSSKCLRLYFKHPLPKMMSS